MRLLGRAVAVLLVGSLSPPLLAGCGGCNRAAAQDAGPPDAAHDAGRWCDGGCPPPPAQAAWDHVVLSAPRDIINICGVVVLPTGIAILAPPKYILLADKTDGHLIAKASWPTAGNNYPSSCGPAIARSSGNLAALMEDHPSSGDEAVVREYAGSDLSPGKTTVLSKTPGPSVIGELGGEIYVLERAGAVTPAAVYLHALPDSGSVNTQLLASGDGVPDVQGSFGHPPRGGLLTCGSYSKYGPPAVLRIDPPKTMTKTLSFAGGTGAVECRLIPGPSRDLVFWGLVHQPPHWDIVSADGTQLIADTVGPSPGVFTTAYGEGAFVTVESSGGDNYAYLYVTDPDTAATRGPYSLPVIGTTIGDPGVAGDGDNLWVAYDDYGDAVRLMKLGPLPK